MLSARAISRGFSIGNLAVKRCKKRPQTTSHRVSDCDREMNLDGEEKYPDLMPLKKIKSHVYYSKKQTKQMCNDEKSEIDDDDLERQQFNNSKYRNQSKIKSSSWKRSDKRSSYVKPWRKKSPNWISLQPTKQRSEFYTSNRLSSSECRPGTLYSDVVFGGTSTSPNDLPLILFKKDENILSSSALSSSGCTNTKVRKKTLKRIIPRSRSITLEKISKDTEIDDAFPPLLSAAATNSAKNSSKSRGPLRLKQKRPMKHSLKADHLIVNLNTANKANIFSFGQEDECQSFKSDNQEISECSEEVKKIFSRCDELSITTEEDFQSNEMENSISSSFTAEASINQIAYGLYLKNKFRTFRSDATHLMDEPGEHLQRSEDEDCWKYKYLPIINVKIFEDSEDENGFGYSGYNFRKRSYLQYESGQQIFPRFSRHFDDDTYLSLEKKAMNSLELALDNSNI